MDIQRVRNLCPSVVFISIYFFLITKDRKLDGKNLKNTKKILEFNLFGANFQNRIGRFSSRILWKSKWVVWWWNVFENFTENLLEIHRKKIEKLGKNSSGKKSVAQRRKILQFSLLCQCVFLDLLRKMYKLQE